MESQRMITRIQNRFYPQVKQLVDATSDMTLEVTRQDIRKSQRRDLRNCAIGVACKRALNLDGVIAARSVLYCILGDTATRYIVPKKAIQALKFFDRGGRFLPGDYILKKPWGTNRLGHMRSQPTKEIGKGPKKAHFIEVDGGLRAKI